MVDFIEQDEFERRAARFGRSLFTEAIAEPERSAVDFTEPEPEPQVAARPSGAPDDATMVGQLAVWEIFLPERSNPKDRKRDAQSVQKIVGRAHGGEELWFQSSIGRCNSVTLRFGDLGLYYNSSSHGTMTFVLRHYAQRAAADDGDDHDHEGEVTREVIIIEGPHSRGHADEAGWVAARRFALRVFVACGRAAARTPLDSLRGRAWVELLQSLGVGTAAAQCLCMAFFPWLEGGEVKELNETALWGWISSGYSSDLSTWQEWHRDILERYLAIGSS